MTDQSMVLPDYSGACVANVVPALIGSENRFGRDVLDPRVLDASTVVLLVLDGLGWCQLQDRRRLMPTLCGLHGGPITTVAPSTTAAALTSITTGLAPGEHGVVGYRIAVDGQVLNVLRWSTPAGDARGPIPPLEFQKSPAFNGERPAVVGRSEFAGSGFTQAHMEGVRFFGYRNSSTMLFEVERLTAAREPFVYVYYDGIDKIAHEYGLDGHYDAELRYADRLLADLIELLPDDAALVVTADHGQVHTGDNVVDLPASVLAQVALQSGEARFRWLHARPGRVGALADAAHEAFDDAAWVVSRDAVVDEGWFGPSLTSAAYSRLGDVALVAKGTVAFNDPADTGPLRLVGRHGSVTRDEMLVPLLSVAK